MGKRAQQEHCGGNGWRNTSRKLPGASGIFRDMGSEEETMGGGYLETEGKILYAERCHEGRSIKMWFKYGNLWIKENINDDLDTLLRNKLAPLFILCLQTSHRIFIQNECAFLKPKILPVPYAFISNTFAFSNTSSRSTGLGHCTASLLHLLCHQSMLTAWAPDGFFEGSADKDL